MKLSELVAFRNQLNELSVEYARKLAADKLDVLMHKIESPLEKPVEQLTQSYIPELQSKQLQIYQAFADFDQTVSQVKKRIQEQISEQEKYWFQESYKLFELAEDCEKTDHILYNRRSSEPPSEQALEAEEILRVRLATYADWRSPGMVIRPGIENFVESMVGCDPLYIIDRGYDLLQPCVDRFPQLYQRRLRQYTTNDWSDQPILEKIPDEQFGICLAYKVFDYRPLEIIRRYLEEIYQKLRPGGVLLMTYNDCDRASAVMLVEQFCTSYTPGYLVRDLVQSIGFIQTFTWDDGGPSVWLELKKPGELESLRGGQVVSTIRHKNELFEDVDFHRRKVYTNSEVAELIDQAVSMGFDQNTIDQLIADYPYNLQLAIDEINNRALREQEEKQRAKRVKRLIKEYKIDTSFPGWEETFEEVVREKQHQRQLQEIEAEKRRIADLHQRARSFNINPELYNQEAEIHRLIAEAVDRLEKEELERLRQRALELEAGDVKFIKYGYSAEKLKQLIKEKEEGK